MERATTAVISRDRDSQGGALIRLRGLYPSLKAALRKVADLILSKPEMAIYASVNEVAATAQVSEATVMRFCRTLGFRGFQDFKIALAREIVSPIQRLHEEVEEGDTPHAIVHKVFQANINALQDTMEVLNMQAMEQAGQCLLAARQILLIGVGTSGPIVTDAANKLFRLGLRVTAHTDSHLMMMAAALLSSEDVLVAVSHSGSTRDPVETARVAKEAGAKVICITNNSMSPLTRVADIVLVTASRETRFRQEAMASRLCQTSIIDSLYTLVALARPQEALANLSKIENVIVTKQY
ncbi:MAG: MurR/RpiR family transcriptional regulator [Deltaproteobacteria bacterium]|nr:MurR/RpiR family transcriptional regulator [Deltaproteobacteria bacterium]